jgi:hypothetical protein
MTFDLERYSYIGTTATNAPFGIAQDDRRRHLHIIGQTGTGKSTAILNLISQDLAMGRGQLADLGRAILRKCDELATINACLVATFQGRPPGYIVRISAAKALSIFWAEDPRVEAASRGPLPGRPLSAGFLGKDRQLAALRSRFPTILFGGGKVRVFTQFSIMLSPVLLWSVRRPTARAKNGPACRSGRPR